MASDGGSPPPGRRAEEIAVAMYKEVYRNGAGSVGEAAKALGLTDEEASAGTFELLRLGLLAAGSGTSDQMMVVPPETAIVRVLERDRSTLTRYRDMIADTSATLDRIIEEFLPLGPGPRLDLEFEIIYDLSQVATMLDMMTNLGRQEMLSMNPGPMPSEQALAESRHRDLILSQRGLRLRTIYATHVTTVPYVADYLRDLARCGYEVRTAAQLPVRMVICDRRRALIPLDPEDGRAGAIVIDGEVMVRTLVKVFEHCWLTSARIEGEEDGEGGPSGQEQTVLRLLAVGMKDEQVARAIGVSVRTVSRMVSELMRRLGVQSRFQAGVRAAQLGWLE